MANVIGDIAGQWKTLQALLKKMPDEEPISLGDMVDRGPQSKEVVEFFMKNGRAILGNHEHMMLDHHYQNDFYERGLWVDINGGGKTLDSFGYRIPEEVARWASRLPKYLEITYGEDAYLLSHAFLADKYTHIMEGCNLGLNATDYPAVNDSFIWNRGFPVDRDYTLQITGHNAWMGLRYFSNKGFNYGVCIDTSKQKVLTGINIPTGTIYQQEYIS